MQSIHMDGWRFDTGPSLLLFPDKYKETFEALGTSLEAAVSLQRVDPIAYRVFFPESPSYSIDLLYNVEKMSEQLECLEKGAGKAYPAFLQMARHHLDLGLPYFIDRDFSELKEAKGLLDLLPKLTTINPWQLLGPEELVLRGFFRDPRLRAALTFQTLYVGLAPSNAPAVFTLLAGTELTDGVWYPMGGFGGVRDALRQCTADAGVDIRTNAAVRCIRIEQGAVRGVVLEGGEVVEADVVVSNRDLPATYADLMVGDSADQEDYIRKKSNQLVSKLKYSTGVIGYSWCVNKPVSRLRHHNVFLSQEYKKSWTPARGPDDFVQYPNFYVHVPSKTDPTASPAGCESVMILLPVANMQQPRGNGSDYSELIEEGRRRILRSFQAANVDFTESDIQRELVIDPSQWQEKYGVTHGAAFGLSHSLDQLSLFRPGNKDDNIRGLYFVGASTIPGNGVPLCFIGARLTAERILRDYSSSA